MPLKESLPLLPGIDDFQKRPAWVVDGFPEKEERIVQRFWGPADIALKVNPVRAKASDVFNLKAKQFVELLKSGVKPGEAAHRLHTSVRSLMNKEDAQRQIRETVENFTFDAAVRKLLVRAMANKVLLEADKANDTKTTLEVIKIINADSEVGVDSPPQMSATLVMDPALKELLDRTVPIPALSEAPVVDAEFAETNNAEKAKTDSTGHEEGKSGN